MLRYFLRICLILPFTFMPAWIWNFETSANRPARIHQINEPTELCQLWSNGWLFAFWSERDLSTVVSTCRSVDKSPHSIRRDSIYHCIKEAGISLIIACFSEWKLKYFFSFKLSNIFLLHEMHGRQTIVVDFQRA